MKNDKEDVKQHALTERRIDEIMHLMRSLQFIRGETGKILAKQWGLSESRVAHLTAQASQRIRQHFGDPKEIATTIQIALDKIFRDALEHGERKHAIDALRLWAEVSGAKSSVKHEFITTEATPAKAAQVMREKFGAVTPKFNDEELSQGCTGDAERGVAPE